MLLALLFLAAVPQPQPGKKQSFDKLINEGSSAGRAGAARGER